MLGVSTTDPQARVIGESCGFISTTWQLTLATDPPGLLPAHRYWFSDPEGLILDWQMACRRLGRIERHGAVVLELLGRLCQETSARRRLPGRY